MPETNDNLILLCGKARGGKTHSLMNMNNPEGIMYLNTENGKKTPFKNKFGYPLVITDPMQVYSAFDEAEEFDDCHTIVIDSLTYLMDQFESQYILPLEDKRSAWGNYAQYFKNLMQQYVANSSKNVIMTAHVTDEINQDERIRETYVPVKGQLKKVGLESAFSCIVMALPKPLKDLEKYQSDLLTIDEDDKAMGFKHIFQTMLTPETVNSRIRGGYKMWDRSETFINNDVQLVLDRLHEYYED